MQSFCRQLQKMQLIGNHMMRLTFCTDFVQFVNCVLQKTYKGSLSQLVVQVLYSFYIVCMYIQKTQVHRQFHLPSQLCMVCSYIVCTYKKHTFQLSSSFQFALCTSFVATVCSQRHFCMQLAMQEFEMYTRFWQLISQLATFKGCIIRNFDWYIVVYNMCNFCIATFCIVFIGTFFLMVKLKKLQNFILTVNNFISVDVQTHVSIISMKFCTRIINKKRGVRKCNSASRSIQLATF